MLSDLAFLFLFSVSVSVALTVRETSQCTLSYVNLLILICDGRIDVQRLRGQW
jgi:hypothetical protein